QHVRVLGFQRHVWRRVDVADQPVVDVHAAAVVPAVRGADADVVDGGQVTGPVGANGRLHVQSLESASMLNMSGMNWTLEVVVVPVSDIDRAKAFYADRL